ncbi:hypothetical protein RLEG12_01030 (plasmid) [Rhizobium leguminosarum bv. trifolii CB782]|nr:hypothetical protein RLEG12_01030 [Rhizobium leguminosarum bv. trifolii CB782]
MSGTVPERTPDRLLSHSGVLVFHRTSDELLHSLLLRKASFITGQVLYVDGGMLQQLRPLQLDSPWPDSIKAQLSALT